MFPALVVKFEGEEGTLCMGRAEGLELERGLRNKRATWTADAVRAYLWGLAFGQENRTPALGEWISQSAV